jgi:quercetin dioxygenase-like cupin family protein
VEAPQLENIMFGIPTKISSMYAAEGVQFITVAPSDKDLDYHNPPTRVLCIVLSGRMEFQVSDGDVRMINPGDVALIEDTEGKGHIARHPDGLTVAFIRVPMGLST